MPLPALLRLTLVAALFAAHAAHAAPPAPLATSAGAWKPLKARDVNPKSGLYFGHGKDQVAKMTANMIAFMDEIHKTTPFINPPRGFDITVYGTICEYNCPKGMPIASEASFLVHEYTLQPNGKARRVDEGPGFNFHFNDVRRLFGTTGMDDKEGMYFVEPQIVEHVGGHPVYRGGLLMLTKRDRPLFNYISMERGLGERIRTLEDNKATLAKHKAGQTDPKQIAYLDRIAKRDQDQIDKFQARLAAMSPAQRAAPYQDPDGQRYVTINRDFYDKSLPPSALQMLIVDMYKFDKRFRDTHGPYTVEAVETIQKQLDPQRLLNMLE